MECNVGMTLQTNRQIKLNDDLKYYEAMHALLAAIPPLKTLSDI